jgi:cysteine desulfurase / selenocysteine lyase
MKIDEVVHDESLRRHEFPVTAHQVYMAHAGVTALPRVAAEALREFAAHGSQGNQEGGKAWKQTLEARTAAAELLGCRGSEIALLGPTSLGLSLVANGLDWAPGDEVVYYQEDYPANVYPWTQLARLGVRPVALRPPAPGAITWEVVEASLTARTKLVALASCHFLSGYRLDVETIGRNLQARGVLFCVDAIQTLGAFPLSVEHVDFLSADSHKWLLGPAGAGIVYVKTSRQEILRPSLLGAWNVQSPEFVAQEAIEYYEGARRYEPGILNLPGIIGMVAALRMLLEAGIDNVGARILHLRRVLLEHLRPLGFHLYLDELDLDPATADRVRTGIVTVTHPTRDLPADFQRLTEAKISVSLRANRAGTQFIRFSPHFYNTEEEIARTMDVLRQG